jgi:hypothetical protein
MPEVLPQHDIILLSLNPLPGIVYSEAAGHYPFLAASFNAVPRLCYDIYLLLTATA